METEAVREHNRRATRKLPRMIVACGLVLVALGTLLIVSQIPRADRELRARSSGPVVEVAAQGRACPPDGPCRTEFLEVRPDGSTGRRAYSDERVAPGTTRRVHIDEIGNTVFVGSSCCRDDLAFPVGGVFVAWGIGFLLVALVPVRPSERGTARLNRSGRMLPAMLVLPVAGAVAIAIQLADWQPASVADAALAPTALPALAGVLTLTAGWWRRSVTATVGRLTVRSAWRTRSVILGPSTTARCLPGTEGPASRVSLDDGTERLTLRVVRWGDPDRFGASLYRVLTRSGVPDVEQELLTPPRVPAGRVGVLPPFGG